MKYRLTPFLVACVGLIGLGIYVFSFPQRNESGWSFILSVICFGLGVVSFAGYKSLAKHYKNKYWRQVGIELLIIVSLTALFFGKGIIMHLRK